MVISYGYLAIILHAFGIYNPLILKQTDKQNHFLLTQTDVETKSGYSLISPPNH